MTRAEWEQPYHPRGLRAEITYPYPQVVLDHREEIIGCFRGNKDDEGNFIRSRVVEDGKYLRVVLDSQLGARWISGLFPNKNSPEKHPLDEFGTIIWFLDKLDKPYFQEIVDKISEGTRIFLFDKKALKTVCLEKPYMEHPTADLADVVVFSMERNPGQVMQRLETGQAMLIECNFGD